MPLYNYKAVDALGKNIDGTIAGDNEQDVAHLLREQSLMPLKISKKEQGSKDVELFAKKVKALDLAVFCKQLGTMLKSGMSIDRALTLLQDQIENPTLRKNLMRVNTEVKQGVAMSKAMETSSDIFPAILIHMVAAGESTGNLDESLERMAVHFEKENKIRNKIRGAMTYPLVLLCLTVVIALVLIIFIVPTFTELFQSAGSDLPGLTQVLVDLSDSLLTHWYIYLFAVAIIIIAIRMFMNSTQGRLMIDSWKLTLPVLKTPMGQIVAARFTRTLSTMLSSGISLIPALESAAGTCNNALVKQKVEESLENIRRGEPLANELDKTGVFPPMMTNMIRIGEESGELDEMLGKTADFYDEQYETAIQRVLGLLEPLMIVMMAGVVGFVVIAMYLPMFDMYDVIA